MDVTVYKQEFIFPMPIGSDFTKFELTGNSLLLNEILETKWKHFIEFFSFLETLNGHILAVQNSSSQHMDHHFVSTGEETELMVQFHDPENFLRQAQDIIYYWFVDDVNYGTTKVPLLKFNFTAVKNHSVMVDVYATFAEPTTTSMYSELKQKIRKE